MEEELKPFLKKKGGSVRTPSVEESDKSSEEDSSSSPELPRIEKKVEKEPSIDKTKRSAREKEKERRKDEDKPKLTSAHGSPTLSLSRSTSSKYTTSIVAALPLELLCKILAFLYPSELLTMSTTCKSLNEIIGEDFIWKPHLSEPRMIFYARSSLTKASTSKAQFFKIEKLHSNWTDSKYAATILRSYNKPVKHLRLDTQNGLLAAASDNLIEVWSMNDLGRGQLKKHRSIRTHLSTVRCFDFDDGRLVFPFGVRWSDLQIFDVQNEKMISHWSAETVLQGSVDALAMKSGVVIAGGTNAVAWNVETKQSIASFPVQRRGTVNCIQYLPESKLVALSHKGKKVRTYDLRTSKRIATVSGHNHLIHSFRLNGDTMATCSKDRTARVWDVRMDFALRSILVGHTDSIHAIHLDPWRLLTGGRDHEVRMWDLSSDSRSSVAVYESEEPVFTLVADESRLITGAMQLKMSDFASREKLLQKSMSSKSLIDRVIELACGFSGDRTSNPEDS